MAPGSPEYIEQNKAEAVESLAPQATLLQCPLGATSWGRTMQRNELQEAGHMHHQGSWMPQPSSQERASTVAPRAKVASPPPKAGLPRSQQGRSPRTLPPLQLGRSYSALQGWQDRGPRLGGGPENRRTWGSTSHPQSCFLTQSDDQVSQSSLQHHLHNHPEKHHSLLS